MTDNKHENQFDDIVSELETESLENASLDQNLDDLLEAEEVEASAEDLFAEFANVGTTEVKQPTASAESIARDIADINSFGSGEVVASVSKKKKPKKKHKNKSDYYVSNWDIIRNYSSYSTEERKLYRYIFIKRISEKVWPTFRFLILFGLSFVVLYPILYMISTAIRPQVEMSDPSIAWIPKTIRWENFSESWDFMEYPKTFGQTLMVNIVSAVLSVGTCALTGYGFARYKFKGSGFLFGIVIMQIIVPTQILLIPLFMQFRYFDIAGLFNAMQFDSLNITNNPLLSYIKAIMGQGIRSGLFILLFRQFFKGLPKELEDAAYLDGCGPFQTFIKIMVPNASSSFLTVFIFSIVWYWNDYYESTIFFPDLATISKKIANMGSAFPRLVYGADANAADVFVWMQAGCLLAIIPIIIMYVCLQKYFTEGIERSGLVA